MKIGLPIFGAQNVHFWSENSDSADRRLRTAAARKREGILGKLKKASITTISRLPAHPRLVKFSSGRLSYRGLVTSYVVYFVH